jgi:hypothetical protein
LSSKLGFAVVHAAGDDRLIRVAFEKTHDHFVADARNVQRAPAFAGPYLRDANPARAVLVHLAVTVPMELHLHARVLVGVDLLALRSHDHRGLRTMHDGLVSLACRAERRAQIDSLDRTTEFLVRVGHAGVERIGRERHAHAGDQVLDVEIFTRVLRELEASSGRQAGGTALPAQHHVG